MPAIRMSVVKDIPTPMPAIALVESSLLDAGKGSEWEAAIRN